MNIDWLKDLESFYSKEKEENKSFLKNNKEELRDILRNKKKFKLYDHP